MNTIEEVKELAPEQQIILLTDSLTSSIVMRLQKIKNMVLKRLLKIKKQRKTMVKNGVSFVKIHVMVKKEMRDIKRALNETRKNFKGLALRFVRKISVPLRYIHPSVKQPMRNESLIAMRLLLTGSLKVIKVMRSVFTRLALYQLVLVKVRRIDTVKGLPVPRR